MLIIGRARNNALKFLSACDDVKLIFLTMFVLLVLDGNATLFEAMSLKDHFLYFHAFFCLSVCLPAECGLTMSSVGRPERRAVAAGYHANPKP